MLSLSCAALVLAQASSPSAFDLLVNSPFFGGQQAGGGPSRRAETYATGLNRYQFKLTHYRAGTSTRTSVGV